VINYEVLPFIVMIDEENIEGNFEEKFMLFVWGGWWVRAFLVLCDLLVVCRVV
jgi:hypothetical protein